MTPNELEQLLRLVAAHDGRTVGEADAVIWTAGVGDLAYRDAEAALLAYVQDGHGWLMPAMIRRHVKQLRADRLARLDDTAPPDADPDDPQAYRQALLTMRQTVADGTYVPPPQPAVNAADTRALGTSLADVFRSVP